MATRKVKPAEPVEAAKADEPVIEIQAVAIALPPELAKVRANLAAIRAEIGNRVYDMTTAEDEEACRKDRQRLVRLRTTVEAIRVAHKKPILDAGRALDAEAGNVTTEIAALEDPRSALIKALDTQRAEAKAERERIERERVEGIKAKIAAMDRRPMFGARAADIEAMIVDLPKVITTKEYEEFTNLAQGAWNRAIIELSAAHDQAEATERQAAELAAQLEAANTARREAEERERIALVAQVEAERAARAETEAREKAEAEARAEAERILERAQTVIDNAAPTVSAEDIAPMLDIDVTPGPPKFAATIIPDGPSRGQPLMIVRPLTAEQMKPIAGRRMFETLAAMCEHMLNLLVDERTAEMKVRLVTRVLRENEHLWWNGTKDDAQTGGGGAVDERKPTVAE